MHDAVPATPPAVRSSTAGGRAELASRPLLELRDVSKAYGGIRALSHVNMRVSDSGVIHALAGENGSGKSTLLGILSGLQRADSGSVHIRGEDLNLHSPADAVRHGIIAVSQETAVASGLTVTENILMGRLPRRRGLVDWAAARHQASGLLERLGMQCSPTAIVGSLRPDQRQMVEIARALAMNPRVLILDEPTSSLTEDEVEALLGVIARLKTADVATILVTHRLEELFAVAGEVTVLRGGKVTASGPVSEFDSSRLVGAMIGEPAPDLSSPPIRQSADPCRTSEILSVSGLRSTGVADASFTLQRGEILGVAGLVGSGRGDLLRALFGAAQLGGGVMSLGGKAYHPRSSADAIASGFGYVPPERKTDGLVLSMTVLENMAMVATASARGLRPRHYPHLPIGPVLDGLRLRADAINAPAGTLSGGNQQKVAFAKWLMRQPTVLLLDEPTRGVDVVARQQIHDSLRAAAADGLALVVSSSENPELLELCDRILVMFAGRVTASFARADIDEQKLAACCGGHKGEMS